MRRVLMFAALTTLTMGCEGGSIYEEYPRVELAVRAETCACDDGLCELLEGELWVDPTSDQECIESGIFSFDAAYEHANCRFGALVQFLACSMRSSCGDRASCLDAFRSDARFCERTPSDVLGRLAVEFCRDPGTDAMAIGDYYAAVDAGLDTRCTVGRACQTTFEEFRECFTLSVTLDAAYYARCSAPGWRLYDRCLRERGNTAECAHILEAAVSCQPGNQYTGRVNRCLDYIR